MLFAQVLLRHSRMRRCLYVLAGARQAILQQQALAQERTDAATAREGAEAEVMRLGIDNRRLIRANEKLNAGEQPTDDPSASSASGVPGLKIPPRGAGGGGGRTPRSGRSLPPTPRSARTSGSAAPSSPRVRRCRSPLVGVSIFGLCLTSRLSSVVALILRRTSAVMLSAQTVAARRAQPAAPPLAPPPQPAPPPAPAAPPPAANAPHGRPTWRTSWRG